MKTLIYILLFLTVELNAQSYNRAFGIRQGLWKTTMANLRTDANTISETNSILKVKLTGKTFISENSAIEGILHLWKSTYSANKGGTGLYILYEKHNRFKNKNLSWYYGGGGGVGSWYCSKTCRKAKNHWHKELQLDAVLGMEYVFENLPLNISLDWKPELDLIRVTRDNHHLNSTHTRKKHLWVNSAINEGVFIRDISLSIRYII